MPLDLSPTRCSQSRPSSSSRLAHTIHHHIQYCCPLWGVPIVGSTWPKTKSGTGQLEKWDPRVCFEQGVPGKRHVGVQGETRG